MSPLRCMSLNSCLDKKECCLNFWQLDKVFKILHVRLSVYFVDVELLPIEKNALYCAMLFLDHLDVAKYSIKFCNCSAVLGHDFQNKFDQV